MTALVYREDDRHVTVIDEDDGCPTGNHRRDELCARTRVEALPDEVMEEAARIAREWGPKIQAFNESVQAERGGPT